MSNTGQAVAPNGGSPKLRGGMGLGGCTTPPFTSKMIGTALPCKRGGDMICYRGLKSWMALIKQRGKEKATSQKESPAQEKPPSQKAQKPKKT